MEAGKEIPQNETQAQPKNIHSLVIKELYRRGMFLRNYYELNKKNVASYSALSCVINGTRSAEPAMAARLKADELWHLIEWKIPVQIKVYHPLKLKITKPTLGVVMGELYRKGIFLIDYYNLHKDKVTSYSMLSRILSGNRSATPELATQLKADGLWHLIEFKTPLKKRIDQVKEEIQEIEYRLNKLQTKLDALQTRERVES